MYNIVKIVHSYWAYLVLLILLIASINAFLKLYKKKDYYQKDLRISLFALIVSHIQLLLGIILFFISPFGIGNIQNNGMSQLTSDMRLLAVEHPFMAVLAIILITIGFSKHKKKLTARLKFRILFTYYGIAFILLASRLPWSNWLGI